MKDCAKTIKLLFIFLPRVAIQCQDKISIHIFSVYGEFVQEMNNFSFYVTLNNQFEHNHK